MSEVPFQTRSEESVEASARHGVLDYDHVLPFNNADTTPTVKNLRHFLAVGSAVITNFDDGAPAQRIHIIGNGLTTVDHNATIKRAGAAAAVLDADVVYRFTAFIPTPGNGVVWYEDVGGTGGGGGAPALHASTHENGGTDEINVADLSGVLADEQDAGKIKGVDVDDTNIADGRVLVFRSGSGDLEYEDVPGSNPADDTQVWMPLTTVVAGVPELVWDASDSLIPTLVPV